MQISRSIRLACVTAMVIFPLALSAQDNDAQTDTQIKLRQALEQKLNELQANPVVPAPPPSAALTNAPAKPRQQAPAVKKPAPVTAAPKPAPAPVASQPVAVPPLVNPPAQTKVAAPVAPKPAPVAEPPAAVASPKFTPPPDTAIEQPADDAKSKALAEALSKAMNATPAQPPVTTKQPAVEKQSVVEPVVVIPPQTPPAVVSTPKQPKAASKGKFVEFAEPAPVVPAPMPVPARTTEPQPVMVSTPGQPSARYEEFSMPASTDAADKVREAMREKMTSLNAQPQIAHIEPSGLVGTERPRKAPKGSLVLPPLQGPDLGISASKEGRLQDLLQLYRSDAISAEKYHAARARILSEP